LISTSREFHVGVDKVNIDIRDEDVDSSRTRADE